MNDGTYLHRAMKKYGIENFIIEAIDTAYSQIELDEKEIFWITKLNSINKKIGYNLKSSKGKCGGDTLSSHPNIEDISIKISNSKIGGLNPQSKKVKAIDINTGNEIKFNSFSDCQKSLNIPRHDIIGRRCKHIISKPYKNQWLFEYVD